MGLFNKAQQPPQAGAKIDPVETVLKLNAQRNAGEITPADAAKQINTPETLLKISDSKNPPLIKMAAILLFEASSDRESLGTAISYLRDALTAFEQSDHPEKDEQIQICHNYLAVLIKATTDDFTAAGKHVTGKENLGTLEVAIGRPGANADKKERSPRVQNDAGTHIDMDRPAVSADVEASPDKADPNAETADMAAINPDAPSPEGS